VLKLDDIGGTRPGNEWGRQRVLAPLDRYG
jgi:hypothetical protein